MLKPVAAPAPAAVRPRAAPAPAAGPAVESFSEEEYVVQAGDTFASIAAKKYLSKDYAEALRLYNRNDALLSDPGDALKPGKAIAVPEKRILELRYGHTMPKQAGAAAATEAKKAAPVLKPVSYRVPATVMIGDVARQKLGDIERWKQVRDLNPQLDPSQPIPAGTQLKLPPDARNSAELPVPTAPPPAP